MELIILIYKTMTHWLCRLLFDFVLSIISEWQRNLRENLQSCRAAIFRQQHCSHFLQKTTLPETSYLFLLESSLFDMVTSGLSEGCFYAVVFRQGCQKYVRFLESGIFQGFFESKGKLMRNCHVQAVCVNQHQTIVFQVLE